MTWLDWAKRQVKEYPDTVTVYFRPYWNEVVKPTVMEWRRLSPIKEGEGIFEYQRRLYSEDPSRKRLLRQDYLKYVYNKTKDRLFNKSDNWFDTLKMTGAVTSTSSGTAALFNNKTGGGKRRKKKKDRKR